MEADAAPPTGNRFLDALPAGAALRCVQAGAVRAFAPRDVIAHRGDRVAAVHFPIDGAVSEIEQGLDGGSVEVIAIGFEGVSGIEALLDAPDEPFLRIVHVPTTALVIPVASARLLRDREPALNAMIRRYAAARLQAAGITIGCNARHDVHARLARWLLRMSDRVGHGDFELTHETVSLMLGVRRPTVTRAVSLLEEKGAIDTARGSVRVRSRALLERLTCSCYPESRDVFDRVYGDDGRRAEI